MIYVLTTNRSGACYSAVFKYIEKYIFKLEPDEIITDFEAGLRKSINECYPNVVLRGCWYHYCVKVRERFAKLRLKSLLKEDQNARFIKMALMHLPLLPAERFHEGYAYIKRFTQDSGLSNALKRVFEYYDYWIMQVLTSFCLKKIYATIKQKHLPKLPIRMVFFRTNQQL